MPALGTMNQHEMEVRNGERFTFGANWARFLELLDESRIQMAEDSLRNMLGVESLAGMTFLDAGSGSGLFSLAAVRLGAKVHSFDFDPRSVACAAELKRRYFCDDSSWTVAEASVLDQSYLKVLGSFDFVYSWGVLHHTGKMWEALGNLVPLVAPSGKLFVSIYNEQGWISNYWKVVKRTYNKGTLHKLVVCAVHFPYLVVARWAVRSLLGRGALDRGMAYWRDMLDWLGGHPFEVAKPEEIFTFFKKEGFEMSNMKTCGGRHGCNEFVFVKA